MKLTLLGPPGAGKGAQAVRICDKYGLLHISTGDMLRAEIEAESELGRAANEYVSKGDLVPTKLVVEMVKSRLSRDDAKRGCVLDGFPRTLEQAKTLDSMLDLSLVINLAVDSEILIKRITERRTCSSCKASFSVTEVPDGICKRCGGDLGKRDDDNLEVLTTRLQVYEERTAPILDYYADNGLLVSIDGVRSIEEVFADVAAAIDARCLS